MKNVLYRLLGLWSVTNIDMELLEANPFTDSFYSPEMGRELSEDELEYLIINCSEVGDRLMSEALGNVIILPSYNCNTNEEE